MVIRVLTRINSGNTSPVTPTGNTGNVAISSRSIGIKVLNTPAKRNIKAFTSDNSQKTIHVDNILNNHYGPYTSNNNLSGTYGSSNGSSYPHITIDSRGRITSASNVSVVTSNTTTSTNIRSSGPAVVFGNGTDTTSLHAGQIFYVRLPYSGTIKSWQIVSNQNCNCIIDIWKEHETLPTDINTIVGADKPFLLIDSVNTSNNLSSWISTNLSEGDVLAFHLETLSGNPKQIRLDLVVT